MSVKIVFFESALELIPESLRNHPQIRTEWKKNVKKKHRGILLDGGIHRPLIDSLEQSERRGRPDIIHHSLLNIVYSPLFRNQQIQVYIHTRDDLCLRIPSNWRVPVNYNRFCGLFSQLLLKRRVPLSGDPILAIEHCSLAQLLARFKESEIYLCEEPTSTNKLISRELSDIQFSQSAIFLIGGYQHGEISLNSLEMMKSNKNLISIHLYKEIMPAWVIVAKLITWLESRNQ